MFQNASISAAVVPLGITLALLIAAATPVVAQKVCDRENEAVAPTFSNAAASWFCIKRANTTPMIITGVEFLLNSTGPSSGVDVGVWDEDPTTGKPLTLLASAPVTLIPNLSGFYGAQFQLPVILVTPGNYFVGVRVITGVQVSLARGGGVITPHWWNPTAGWSGPHSSGAWGIRVYCGLHNSVFTSYGTGKPGTHGAPDAIGLGFPNITNPIRLVVSSALGGAQGVLLFGTRAPLSVPPIGTLYVMPLVSIPLVFSNTAGIGHAGIELTLPDDPTLISQTLSWQGVVLDAGAVAGIAHSQGVEITIGG